MHRIHSWIVEWSRFPFYTLIKENKLNILNKLLETTLDVNETDYKNETPLFYAVRLRNIDAVRLLLKHDAVLIHRNKDNKTPLQIAKGFLKSVSAKKVHEKYSEIANLLENTETAERNQLKFAFEKLINIHGFDYKQVRSIVKNGLRKYYDEWYIYPFQSIFDKNLIEVLDILIDILDINAVDENGETPLFYAVRMMKLDAVDWCIKNRANLEHRNKDGKKAFQVAVGCALGSSSKKEQEVYDQITTLLIGNDSCEYLKQEIRDFVDEEININSYEQELALYINEMKKYGCCFVPDAVGYYYDSANYQLLDTAFDTERDELVKFLLECGLEPQCELWGPMGYYDRVNYLVLYADRGNLEMVMYLVENKYAESADILDDGLYRAITEGNLSIVQYLLEKGADPAKNYSFYQCEEYEDDYFHYYPDGHTGIENNTHLYFAIIHDHLDIARLLVDYGASPYMVRREYDITITQIRESAADEDFDEFDPANYECSSTLSKEERIIDAARDRGYKNFADEIEVYTEGNRLRMYDIAYIRNKLKENGYDLLKNFLMNIEVDRYCKRDRDLLRNANYRLATQFFITNDFPSAVLFYQKALVHAESNEEGINTLEKLKTADLSKWEHEGEKNAPSYYCAFNISCAYSHLGKIDKAFDWLALAITMNPGLKKTAQTDKDLQALRAHEDRFNKLVR